MKSETILVEVRAAEGGQDSKNLVETLAGAYIKRCVRYCL